MQRLTVKQHGIHAFLHLPDLVNHQADRYQEKALIVLGGSEGNENIPLHLGARFAREGMPSLGLCYWNAPGLSDDLIEVPIELIERAVTFLQEQGYQHIGIYGISKGAELALLSASLISKISCVVALSPLAHVMPGILGNKSLFSKTMSP